jgi:hypothetical protein
MKNLRVLRVLFSDPIRSYEVPAIRAAIAQKAGFEHILFHNHLSNNELRYAYPLIQYKRHRSFPQVVCLGEGVESVHHFFNQPDWSIEISGRTLQMRIQKMDMDEHYFRLEKTAVYRYKIENWIALNPEAYQQYNALSDTAEQKTFLSKKLIGNLLSMAKGLGWTVEQLILCEINEVLDTRTTLLKQNKMLCFDAIFDTNILLPNSIGLGKSASFGYGTVQRIKQQYQPTTL